MVNMTILTLTSENWVSVSQTMFRSPILAPWTQKQMLSKHAGPVLADAPPDL